MESVNPAPIIKGICRSLTAVHRDFTFETDFSNLEGANALIIKKHLEQILLILIDNAMKYSYERKSIKINVSNLKDMVLFEVMDQGIGIPKEDLPYILNRFYRVDKARSRELGGNGLGLAIAKQIVEKYKGQITVGSVENEGTTVSFTIPASD